jgi:membrane associated rhomboid family serine protease
VVKPVILLLKTDDLEYAKKVQQYLKSHKVDCTFLSEESWYSIVLLNDWDHQFASKLINNLKEEQLENKTYNINYVINNSKSYQEYLTKLKNYPLTCVVIAIVILVYLFQFFFPNEVFGLLFFDFALIKEGEVWRLLTPAFMHKDFFHIAFNLVLFTFFATLIERYISFGKLLLLIVSAGIIGNLSQYIANDYHGNFLGLSGVVYATIAYMAIISRSKFFLNQNLVPAGILKVSVLIIVFELLFSSTVANACHIVGLAVGLILGVYDFIMLNRAMIKK